MQTNAEVGLYLDASALVKLVVPERETDALTAFVGRQGVLTSSSLARVEVMLAVRQHGAAAIATGRSLVEQLDLVQLDDELLDMAAGIDMPLRSLDAIHVASALELGDTLEAFVTYDVQMTRAANALGLPVAAPA